MKTLRYLFLAALFAAVLGAFAELGAQTSSGRILVSGKEVLRQGDVDTIIEFYEWAFGTAFTGTERERFQEFTVQEFRRDPAAGRKNSDVLIGALQKLKAKTEDEQNEFRQAFTESFVKDLRADNDGGSALLLEVYDRARSGGDANTSAGDAEASAAQAVDQARSAGGIGNIAGSWVWARSGSTTKTVTGVYLGGNASRFTYDISPNGTVAFTGIMTVMTGGCKLTAFSQKKGRATLAGDRLTINWAPTAFSRDDTCSPQKNYKKTLPAETEVYTVSTKNAYGQTQLCLTDKDETCYSPAN
jgi:hypothetical protein